MPTNQWACTFPQTFPPKLSITRPCGYWLLHHRVSLEIHTYLIVYTLNSHILELNADENQEVEFKLLDKKLSPCTFAKWKNLAPHLFFCRILRQWRSTARTLWLLIKIYFFEKQIDFVFIKSKCWKHWKCKATGNVNRWLKITAYRTRRKYTTKDHFFLVKYFCILRKLHKYFCVS